MKNTPGPWVTEKTGGGKFEIHPSIGTIILLHPDPCEYCEANARLIASAPELLEEHKSWSKMLGHIIVKALQKDYEYLNTIAKLLPIEYRGGESYAKSEAIAKAENK